MIYTYIKFNGKLDLIRKYQLKPIKLPAHRHGYYQAMTHYGALTITKGDFLKTGKETRSFKDVMNCLFCARRAHDRIIMRYNYWYERY